MSLLLGNFLRSMTIALNKKTTLSCGLFVFIDNNIKYCRLYIGMNNGFKQKHDEVLSYLKQNIEGRKEFSDTYH